MPLESAFVASGQGVDAGSRVAELAARGDASSAQSHLHVGSAERRPLRRSARLLSPLRPPLRRPRRRPIPRQRKPPPPSRRPSPTASPSPRRPATPVPSTNVQVPTPAPADGVSGDITVAEPTPAAVSEPTADQAPQLGVMPASVVGPGVRYRSTHRAPGNGFRCPGRGPSSQDAVGRARHRRDRQPVAATRRVRRDARARTRGACGHRPLSRSPRPGPPPSVAHTGHAARIPRAPAGRGHPGQSRRSDPRSRAPLARAV